MTPDAKTALEELELQLLDIPLMKWILLKKISLPHNMIL